ncbi:MAG: hypothetical protein IPK65_00470 [Gammaproteobacteria bacterium]|nr:hypothetical protein [Gammaproteobacteria bacterium]
MAATLITNQPPVLAPISNPARRRGHPAQLRHQRHRHGRTRAPDPVRRGPANRRDVYRPPQWHRHLQLDSDQAEVAGSPYAVTFTAAAGNGLIASQTVSLTVTANQPPVLAPIGNRTVLANTSLAFGISATDSDGPAPLTLAAAGLPGSATFTDHLNGTGTFNWTPSEADVAGSPYTVTFTATGGRGLVGSETIAITVTARRSISLRCSPRSATRASWRTRCSVSPSAPRTATDPPR